MNGQTLRDCILWSDTAPARVLCQVHDNAAQTAVLKIWNVWRAGGGLVQAWLGNAAMRVDLLSPTNIRLRCNGGDSDRVDFEDLRIDLTTFD